MQAQPQPLTAEPVLLAPLAQLRPSPTNPRRRFTDSTLTELADSIAEHHLLQPALVRPDPAVAGGYEIVAGERRWRACQRLHEAGRNPHGNAMPCLVRQLSDRQVLELQLVENIQREDLHPLEEAAHYQRMGVAGMSAEEISHAAGKSTLHVSRRLALLALVPAATDAFLAGQLTPRTALLLARMPAHLQAEALAHLVDWGGEPMGPLAAARFLRERYMLRLAQAPFDVADATLLPGAPACGVCPKRTGASPQLFDDVTEADTCTDTACFDAKRAAARQAAVAHLQDEGHTVLRDDEARKVCAADGRSLLPGWHALDADVPHALGDTELKVREALERANAPAEDIRVVDHPAGPALLYAVSTPCLESALKRIKKHRDQLTPPTKPKPKKDAAPAAELDMPPADDTPPGGPAQGKGSADAHTGPSDDLVAELLVFTPPPTVAGLYNGMTPALYQRQRELTALSVLVAAEVMRQPGELPLARLVPLLNEAMITYGDSRLTTATTARLLGVEPPAAGQPMGDWTGGLDARTAERLLWLLTCSEAASTESEPDDYAQRVAGALGIPTAPLLATAKASVAEQLRLGALANGKPATATKPRKPAGAGKKAAP